MIYNIREVNNSFELSCDEEALYLIRQAVALLKQEQLLNGKLKEFRTISDLTLAIEAALFASDLKKDQK